MIDFQPKDAGALHWAFEDAIRSARERAEKGMVSSAAAYEAQAASVRLLRDRILDTLPEKVRNSYPDYRPPGKRERA